MLPDVRLKSLHALWREAYAAGLGTPNRGLFSDIVACPSDNHRVLANARLVPTVQGTQQRFEDLNHLHDIGELSLNISDCMSVYGHHYIDNIGIFGVDKNNSEWYQVTLGGTQGKDSTLDKMTGSSSDAAEVPAVIGWIVETFTDSRIDPECSVGTLGRVGLEPFKVRTYTRMEESA